MDEQYRYVSAEKMTEIFDKMASEHGHLRHYCEKMLGKFRERDGESLDPNDFGAHLSNYEDEYRQDVGAMIWNMMNMTRPDSATRYGRLLWLIEKV